MSKALIIGAGGVASVVVAKCCQNCEVFEEILIASRTKAKCDALKEKWKNSKTKISTAKLDADNVSEIVEIINEFKPNIVINVALPYQDLTIMDACLEANVSYLDTANYEPLDTARFEYKWQWAYQEKFKEKDLTAILGCGFDPGVTGVFTAYAKKKYFDEIYAIDILDANAGDHGYPFATNFNPEINIREITSNGRFYENGEFIEVPPLSVKKTYKFPEIGPKDIYLLFHEELESLAKNISEVKKIRFWMTFSEKYLTHLKVLENVGMTSIKPINFDGREIVPLQFLKAVLPDPASLGPLTKGKTNIGCVYQGRKNDKSLNYYIYNVCDHEECFKETGAQAISYTTGVPAMIGASLYLTGKWKKPGVLNVEEFDPNPFIEMMPKFGLSINESFSPDVID